MSTAVVSTTPAAPSPLALVSKFDGTADVGGSGFSAAEVVELLRRSCPQFEEVRQGAEVADLHVDNCGKGNGYLSLVLKIAVIFEPPRPAFSCVLKIPMPEALSSMVGGEDGERTEAVGKDGELAEEAENENARMIVEGHNLECRFYDCFHSLGSFPMPRVYAKRPLRAGSKEVGFLLMDNLATDFEVLGIHRTATVAQCEAVGRAIAQFQFHAERREEHRDVWMSQEQNLHLDTFYSSWMPAGLAFASSIPSLQPLIERIRPLCHRGFGRLAIRKKPKQYDAITILHGDIQPFNVFFGRAAGGAAGELTAEIGAIIDFQMLSFGNPAFDLARFLVCSVDAEGRAEADEAAFRAYFEELRRLHEESGERMRFTFEQAHELFELALCQQATFITVFLFFLDAMAKQSGSEKIEMPRMIRRAEHSLQRTVEIMNAHKLNDFDGELFLMSG